MKSISIDTFEACKELQQNPTLDLKTLAKKYHVEIKTIKKYSSVYGEYRWFFEDRYYLLEENDIAAINEYLNSNKTLSLSYIHSKYKIQRDRFKKKLAIYGETYSVHHDREFNRNAFNEIKTEQDAYWLGFLLADGYVYEAPRYTLTLKLGLIDKNHLIKFAKYMGEKNPGDAIKYDVGGSYSHDNKVCYISFTSRTLVDNLVKHGITQRKSGHEIPIDFDREDLQRAYVRGMIDGDGCLYRGRIKYVGSYESCLYIKNYFGKMLHYQSNCSYIWEYGSIYSFQCNQRAVLDALTYIYENSSIYLDRKYNAIAVLKSERKTGKLNPNGHANQR
jgi:hypothetical protein